MVNLGSQSSKCTEIRTPQDPDKISMIDNKRMSITIGVVGGLVVFAGIIIIIVSKHDSKENEEIQEDSLTNAGKPGQPDAPLIFTGPAIMSRSGPFCSSTTNAVAAPTSTVHSVRQSRANSVNSVHKISLADGQDTGTAKLKKNQVCSNFILTITSYKSQLYYFPTSTDRTHLLLH